MVYVHATSCSGTLEENIARIIQDKTELAQDAISTGDQWLQGLTNNQIREALAMSQEISH